MNKKLINNLKNLIINKIKKIFLFFLFLFLFKLQVKVFAFENKIILKINNEIITTIDILNEIKYLKLIKSKI